MERVETLNFFVGAIMTLQKLSEDFWRNSRQDRVHSIRDSF
jgi:hypothetical protein